MGNDLSVVNAARVSFSKESKLEEYEVDDYADNEAFLRNIDHELVDMFCDRVQGTISSKMGEGEEEGTMFTKVKYLSDKDRKLISYLAAHKHEIPFAHTAVSLRVTAPLFIRTHCFKHKVGFVENEVSRRYVTEPVEYFIPDDWRYAAQDKKQGSSEHVFIDSEIIEQDYILACNVAISVYERLLKAGVCPEQARMVLPQSVLTTWIWTGSLLAFARFFNLRSEKHTQKETQKLAAMVNDVIKPLYPVSWKELTK